MAFEEHAFMKEELESIQKNHISSNYISSNLIIRKKKINKGTEILAETDRLERQKDDLIKEKRKKIRELIRFREKYQNWRLCLYRHRTNGKKPVSVEWCESGTGTWKRIIKRIKPHLQNRMKRHLISQRFVRRLQMCGSQKCGH